MSLTDPIVEKIKILYELGESGQYEIIRRTVFIMKAAFVMGKTSKFLVDSMMDKGVKPLELGISLAVSINETEEQHLNSDDRILRTKILETSKNMLEDWYKMVEMNE